MYLNANHNGVIYKPCCFLHILSQWWFVTAETNIFFYLKPCKEAYKWTAICICPSVFWIILHVSFQPPSRAHQIPEQSAPTWQNCKKIIYSWDWIQYANRWKPIAIDNNRWGHKHFSIDRLDFWWSISMDSSGRGYKSKNVFKQFVEKYAVLGAVSRTPRETTVWSVFLKVLLKKNLL